MSKEEDDAELQFWLSLTDEEMNSMPPDGWDSWDDFVRRNGISLEQFQAKYLP